MDEVAKVDTTNRHIRKIKHKWMNFRYSADMFFHALFWRILWKTGLATPYQKFMCKHNHYKKFPDGRCQYCGNKHS